MGDVVKRAYRYRFYPTSEQVDLLNRTFGCVRKVYNMALAERTRLYATERRSMTYGETSAALTGWKRDQRKSRASAEFTRSAFRWCDGQLTLAKMLQPLAIVWSLPLPDGAEPSTVTVSRDNAGRWHVSILVETTIAALPPVEQSVGVDAGLTWLVTLSTGEKISNPSMIEDLNVRGMVRNHRLARAISDAAWSQLRCMLEYKCAWYGRNLAVVDRWYPSSKLCSSCGRLTETMPLSVRAWTCPGCGTVHDRDVNAARNILAAGLAER